ncbi:MAG: hypothetical protein J6328_00415 [Bacilli bacterium]|nr:hypothetical protein [Bacilli bacterium]
MEIQVVLVFETSKLKRTDDAYYQWMLKNYFPNEMGHGNGCGLQILFHYAYMSGKTNYKHRETLKQINSYVKGYSGKTFVVYCFDIDTKTKSDKEFIEGVSSWCEKSGYYVSLALPEIEAVFGYGADKGDKVCRMRLFAKRYPRKDSISKKNLFMPCSLDPDALSYGQTNFCSIIESIVDVCNR